MTPRAVRAGRDLAEGGSVELAAEIALVRGEPDYVGQLPRMMAYRLAHPGTEVFYMGPAWSCWQAVIREDDDGGMTIITRRTLKALLGKLESLDGHPNPPGVP